jgi:UrcA family protein
MHQDVVHSLSTQEPRLGKEHQIMNTFDLAHAQRAARLVMVAGSLSGTAALADEPASLKLTIYPPANHAQAEQVYQRIRAAARQVCETLDSRELGRLRYHERCVNDAVAMAVAQVDSHTLTAIHLAHGGVLPNPRG